jgi:rifampicin phosphotransferase
MTTPRHARDELATVTIDLADIGEGMVDSVGGKADGLAAMIRIGERVPAGFCLTTKAYRQGEIPEQAVLEAYRSLGGGTVAVRSSATAEDLPEASFAGQHDTYLNVSGEAELLAAIANCWDSLDNERASAYRANLGIGRDDVSMAVVVQQMIDPAVAGVVFTANPITGTRTETVIDAVRGLGDKVVDGSVIPDHYRLTAEGLVAPREGSLTVDQLGRLRDAGRRLEQAFGQPQDIEWAIDQEDQLWLLQSRAITTLFPVPESGDDQLHAYLEVGHMQGMRQPITPMGMSLLMYGSADWFKAYGVAIDPEHPGLIADIAGRLFIDLTPMLRNRRMRRRLPEAMGIYGPAVAASVGRLLDDPRFAARPDRAFPMDALVKIMMRTLPDLVFNGTRAMIAPRRAQIRVIRRLDDFHAVRGPNLADPAERIDWCVHGQTKVLAGMMDLLPPLWTSMIARGLGGGLLRGVAQPGEIESTQRGMPHNVTTEMDLKLWSVAVAAQDHRDMLINTDPAELARRYLAGGLPEFGLAEFLAEYGHRAAAEIDIGVPRWAENPTPVFAAIAGYLKITDPDQGADRRFERAAEEAEAGLDQLVGRASRTRPVRAAVAGFLLRRSRSLAGLRELPKFAWLFPLNEARHQLLLAGTELAERGVLNDADDILYLRVPEAEAAAGGEDLTAIVQQRRAVHQRELRRRQVPGLLLSDGTVPELALESEELPEGTWQGMPAAPGRATGTARVVHDPATARIEPGDILIAATTDPGWTPLFMTAAGLVTETGSPVAHGPSVAREYGIPAVICLPMATTRIQSGQTLTIDGTAGTVQVLDDPSTSRGSQ